MVREGGNFDQNPIKPDSQSYMHGATKFNKISKSVKLTKQLSQFSNILRHPPVFPSGIYPPVLCLEVQVVGITSTPVDS